MIIGASCLLSGEDFSKVSGIRPMFYPGREDLIGREMVAAQNFCHLPMFFFGLLFFITMSILAFLLLNKYSAIFVTSFFAFNTFVLNFSRFVHVDTILWFFIAANLLFIYKAYASRKYGKKEKIYFGLSAISIGLAGATKLSFGLFLLFNLFILFDKYSSEIKSLLKKYLKFNFSFGETKLIELIKIILISGILFSLFFLMPFQLNPENVTDVYSAYKSHSPNESGISLNFNVFSFLNNNFLYEINVIDFVLFFISLYTLFYLLTHKRTRQEKFILYYVLTLTIAFLFFRALHFTRVALPYLFSLIFLMSLTFSKRKYAIMNLFKDKKRIFFFAFIIIYIIYSFSIAFSSSPYFEYANPISCRLSQNPCEPRLTSYAANDLGNLLNNLMAEQETFILQPAELFFYSRPEQGLEDWNFFVAFTQQVGREPTLQEKIQLFRPNGRTVRYLIVDPKGGNKYQEDINQIIVNFEPNEKLILKNQEVYWIYDLQNIIQR